MHHGLIQFSIPTQTTEGPIFFIHGKTDIIFGELLGKPEHLHPHGNKGGFGGNELLRCCCDEQVGIGILR